MLGILEIEGSNNRGYKTCPEWLKKAYRRSVRYVCQQCSKHEDQVGKLTPHRIKRGHKGGLYTVCRLNSKDSNIKVVCNGCHKLLHGGEFNKR